ncbi:hypothetical protein J2X13_000479 [Aminobacter aminovorans]|nr:hypothetical protein [Aminobacter aminovorans]
MGADVSAQDAALSTGPRQIFRNVMAPLDQLHPNECLNVRYTIHHHPTLTAPR